MKIYPVSRSATITKMTSLAFLFNTKLSLYILCCLHWHRRHKTVARYDALTMGNKPYSGKMISGTFTRRDLQKSGFSATKNQHIRVLGRDHLGSTLVAADFKALALMWCSAKHALSHPRSTRLVEAFMTKRPTPPGGLILFKGPRISGRASYVSPAKCAEISAGPQRVFDFGKTFGGLGCDLETMFLKNKSLSSNHD